MHALDIVDIDNLVPELDEERLLEIGNSVCSEYRADKDSMDDWLSRNALALKLASMDNVPKTDPWPGAASTKLPLVLNAAMKASAEEFGEILRGKRLVKTEIFGKNTEEKRARAERVTKRMNFQFQRELSDWEEDHDKLIMSKNIVGTVHKKVFYADGKIQCVLRRNGIVINDNVEKIQDAPRVTDEIEIPWWRVKEKVLSEEWQEIDIEGDVVPDWAEDDKVNLFYEQIRRVDLDEDGYPEPYIVTVHEKSKQVVRITPNFTPDSITFNEDIDILEYEALSDEQKTALKQQLTVVRFDTEKARLKYIKYEMIPSWEGGYWGYGFGILLGPLNENCNTLINHLLNAGHLSVKGGGFINSGIKMGGGELRFRSNEWKKVQSPGMDLARNIFPLPVKEPSQTLFSLLGLLMDVLRELSSVTEVMSGEQPRANMPATSIMALIEQGKKLFNSVYKRHFRSLTKEQTALFDLNFLFQDPQGYIDLLDLDIPPEAAMELIKRDFARGGLDILPTANPEFSSKVQRMTEAQAMMEIKDDPRVNGTEVIRMFVTAILDDEDTANQVVPEQPNITPSQVMQQMQQQKQQLLNTNEMRESEAKAKTAEINLQIAQVALQKATNILPLEVERQHASVQKGQYAAIKGAVEMQKEIADDGNA